MTDSCLRRGRSRSGLSIPGADQSRVHYLRTLADSPRHYRPGLIRAGAHSFWAPALLAWKSPRLCASAAWKCMWLHRKSGRWKRFWARNWGDLIRSLHEEHGVIFHLENTATAMTAPA
jgi:hypothetical protein